MVRGAVFADACTMETETRKFKRSSGDRVIAGVAGGLGRYFNIDPVVVRIAFVVLAFFGGAGLLAYFLAWLGVPSDDSEKESFDAAALARRLGLVIGLVALTGVALVGGFFGAAS